MNEKLMQKIIHKCTKENILISAFDSACALKREIRTRIEQRTQQHWSLCGMKTSGGFIQLCFKRSC